MAGEGEIVALESDPRRAVAARQNLAGCGVKANVLIGAAQEVLPGLVAPFDLIIEDAEATGLKIGTVKSHLFRGIEAVKASCDRRM